MEALDRIPTSIASLQVIGHPRRVKDLNLTAGGLYRELKERSQKGDETVEKIMAALRHAVYALGLMGGHDEIEPWAVDLAQNEQKSDGLTDPTNQENAEQYAERLRRIRTVICLYALSALDESSRDRALGPLRARWLKPDRKTALTYFDLGKQEPARHISSDTPLDDLVSIVALTEEPELKEKPVCIRVRRTAQEFLIRRLLTETPEAIEVGGKLFGLKHFKSILDQMPDSLAAGRIGGKSTGVLLAYAALEKESPDFDKQFAQKHGIGNSTELHGKLNVASRLKPNTSRFIGSNVFKQVMDNPQNKGLSSASTLKTYYLKNAASPHDSQELETRHAKIKEAMAVAEFPKHIERQLRIFFDELHGQPIIVRSSSELEDRHGASFAGQYESVELANSGDEKADFEAFKAAILTVYASVFSRNVMEYRRQKGLLVCDEEMGILVQRLNGKQNGDYFYPDIAAVAMSRATQSLGADPRRGAMKIVAGLGEMAVEGEGGRFVMFANPNKSAKLPEEDNGQSEMSVINVKSRKKEHIYFGDSNLSPDVKGYAVERGSDGREKLTCKNIAACSDIPLLLEYIVQKLKHQLGYEVDCEFTLQYDNKEETWNVNLVQCRPQNIPKNLRPSRMPDEMPPERVLLEGENSINGTCCADIEYLLYVDPKVFENGGQTDNAMKDIARYVSEVNASFKDKKHSYLVMAPRRWGSKNETSGIPVNFADFSNAAGFVELHESGSADASMGLHFFQLLMDANMASAYKCGSNDADVQFERKAEHDATHFPPVPERLKQFIKVIDVNATWEKRLEQQHSGTKHKKPKGGWRIHMAQDNVERPDDSTRPMHLYIAGKGQDHPVQIEDENGNGEQ